MRYHSEVVIPKELSGMSDQDILSILVGMISSELGEVLTLKFKELDSGVRQYKLALEIEQI